MGEPSMVRIHAVRLSVLLALALAGCQPSATTPTSPPEPGLSAVPATASPAPTVETGSPTPTIPAYPTPAFPEAQVARSFLLSARTPGCDLPCWNNLHIGASTRADVNTAFGALLNAHPGYDFFSTVLPDGSFRKDMLVAPGLDSGGNSWALTKLGVTPGSSYYLYAFLEKDKGSLAGIAEVMDSNGYYKVPTLPDMLQRLGPPDWIYGVALRGAQTYTLSLYYKNGLHVNAAMPQKLDTATVTVCLDQTPVTEAVILADPYQPQAADRSTMQRTFGAPQDPAPYIFPEAKLTIPDFVRLAGSSSPCITLARK